MILQRHANDDARSGRPVLIGLTGPIACGKTAIGRMLSEIGGTVIDADQLAREATATGSSALPEIRTRFGSAVFAGEELDRAALARIVFADAGALRDLEAIVHPRVRALVEQRFEAAAHEGSPFVAIEAIKLVEGGLAERCDEVWLVECSPAAQRARLADRGLPADDAERRLIAQGEHLGDRLAAALEGRVPVRRISTDGPREQTRDVVEEALAEVLDRQIG
jgi:dephospho-CoA kinase